MITKEEFESKKEKLIQDFLLTKENGKIGLQKSSSNLFRHRNSSTKKIDVRSFKNVITIDEKNLFADVEGMITYEDLVNETLKKGFMPVVVPELKSITIGGAYSGGGIEASSFRYGFVHETILEAEILLSSGKTAICTADNEHKDLFFGFPNSYGSLGYVLRLKVKIIPVKKYVHLRYIKCNTVGDLFSGMKKNIAEGNLDFIDGVIFSASESYIVIGKFTDSAPYESDYTYMKIFYKSIQKKSEDYLSVLNYIWRWDTDWFWCSKNFFVQNPIVRFLWGKRNLTSKVYHKIMRINAKYNFADKLHLTPLNVESVIQDVEIPEDNCLEFAEFFLDKIKISPVWICPAKSINPDVKFDLYITDGKKIYFNFGFWDFVPSTEKDGYFNRLIEEKVMKLKGKKSLYSTSFYPEKEFWELYNGKIYFNLKEKYDPQNVFPNLYEKTVLRK